MKRMIISGGSRGLGAALVSEYRRAGYEITELSRSGCSGDSVQVDLAQPKVAQQILEDEFGRSVMCRLGSFVNKQAPGLFPPC